MSDLVGIQIVGFLTHRLKSQFFLRGLFQFEPHHENQIFHVQKQRCKSASYFFCTQIMQSFFFLNQRYQVSSPSMTVQDSLGKTWLENTKTSPHVVAHFQVGTWAPAIGK